MSITSSSNHEGVTFDKNGDLRVADLLANQVVMFTPAQIANSGAPSTTVIVSDSGSGSGALHYPVAVLVDNGGNLLVSNNAGSPDNVLEYSASELRSTGSPVPGVVISTTRTFNWPQFVFDPPIHNP